MLTYFTNGALINNTTFDPEQLPTGDHPCMGTHYEPYNPLAPSPKHLEVLNFFETLFPDDATRNSYLTTLSSCLGDNKEEKMIVQIGTGSNGKSMVNSLMQDTFGSYYCRSPTSIITKQKMSKHVLLELQNKRVVDFSDNVEPILSTNFKTLCSKDDLVVKHSTSSLGGELVSFKPTFKMFYTCNEMPNFSKMDEGVRRRLIVIPFQSTFVDKADPEHHKYPRDPILRDKMREWPPYFAGILVWFYQNHYLTEPHSTAATV